MEDHDWKSDSKWQTVRRWIIESAATEIVGTFHEEEIPFEEESRHLAPTALLYTIQEDGQINQAPLDLPKGGPPAAGSYLKHVGFTLRETDLLPLSVGIAIEGRLLEKEEGAIQAEALIEAMEAADIHPAEIDGAIPTVQVAVQHQSGEVDRLHFLIEESEVGRARLSPLDGPEPEDTKMVPGEPVRVLSRFWKGYLGR